MRCKCADIETYLPERRNQIEKETDNGPVF